jgi:hypothetical protein
MPITPRIESTPTSRTLAPTSHILLDCQHVLAYPTQHSPFTSSIPWPDLRRVRLTSIVATNACVEFLTTEVLDGNNVNC